MTRKWWGRTAPAKTTAPGRCYGCNYLSIPPDSRAAPFRCRRDSSLIIDNPMTGRHPLCPLTEDAP